MHGSVARPSNIRSEIGECIADLRDSRKLTRERLCRAIDEGASEEVVHDLRIKSRVDSRKY
jgi:hypothetical protein